MPITVTPGQVIGWDDLNAILAQHGSPQGAKSIQELPNKPLSQAERDEITIAGGNPDAPRARVIRYWTEDGSYFDAVLEQPGQQTGDAMAGSGQGSTFRIVEYRPSQTYVAAQRQAPDTAKPPEERVNPADPTRRQVWNPTSRAWEDAGVVAQKPEEVKPPQERVNPADPTRRQVWNPRANNGAGAWEDAGVQAQKPEDAKPKYSQVRQDEQTGAWFGLTPAGTWEPIEGGPGAGSTGKQYVQVTQDKNSGTWFGLTRDGKWEEMQGGPGTGSTPTPPGMPTFTPDITKPGMGTIEYANQLAALRAEGKLTDAQYTQYVTTAQQQATSEASRIDAIISTQRQLQANEVSQRNTDVQASTQRLATSQSALQNALDTSIKMASNFTPESYAAMGRPILPGLLGLQDQRAAAWGGMNMPAPIGSSQYPALAAVGGMGITPGGPVLPAVAGMAPAPNAIGAGAVPGIMQPNQPPPSGPAGATRPWTDSATGPSIIPGTIPAPGSGGADPAMAAAEAARQQAMAGARPPISDPRDAAGYTGPPQQPAVQMPQVDTSMPQIQQQQPQAAILPAALQMGIVAELAASGRYPTEILREAATRMGWG